MNNCYYYLDQFIIEHVEDLKQKINKLALLTQERQNKGLKFFNVTLFVKYKKYK
jgi:hypothetical protein